MSLLPFSGCGPRRNTSPVPAKDHCSLLLPDLGMSVNKDYKPVYWVLFSISGAHLINDVLQSIIPALYPLLKAKYALSFAQIGLITLSFQLTASLLQPVVGVFTDRRPQPFSLVLGMFLSLIGVLALAYANTFLLILLSVALVGFGSSIFHPESSRLARLASGGRRGMAQSVFQIGGNSGSAIGPLLVAFIVIPFGQQSASWFGVVALLGMILLAKVSTWYKAHVIDATQKQADTDVEDSVNISRIRIIVSITVLIILIFSKYFYMAGMTNYFTFYLIEKFNVTVQQSQYYLFAFLGAVAAGTYFGGTLGDKFGRKTIIWISILGAAPFALVLPYVGLFWVVVLAILIGVIIASAFSAILVYAQELLPGRIGLISGLFFGLAFGLGGLGSALLGKLADETSIEYVFQVCSYLPLLGITTWLLPNIREARLTT